MNNNFWITVMVWTLTGWTNLATGEETCIRRPLIFDEAWLAVNNSQGLTTDVFSRNHECWKCPPVLVTSVDGYVTCTLVVSTTFGTDLEIRNQNGAVLCSLSEKFVEHGDYILSLSGNNGTSCSLVLLNGPMVAEMPILYAACGIVVIWVFVKIVACLLRRRKSSSPSKEISSGNSQENNGLPMTSLDGEKAVVTKQKERLKSLDAFRGLSLIIMVFVNYGGGAYWFFDHLPWNGLTVADLVFPWFVFIMGTSMNFSFRGMLKRGKTRYWIVWKVLRRSALLFFFGIMLNTNWGPVDLTHLRVPGVLQRLALTYLLVAFLETAFARKADTAQDRSWAWIRDIVLYLPEWLLAFGILAAYMALTFALPVPGCPTGYVGPGGLHEDRKYENCTGGAAGYIDRLVLGEKHLYGNPTPKAIYQTKIPYDPEGLLGTLSSAFLCFLGLQAGRIFLIYKSHKDRVLRLLVWGVITGAVGAGLCGGSINDGVIPINKNIWSVSFILVTAGLGFLLLCLMYIAVDVVHSWDGEPFIYPGMNPLIIFLCHSIFYRMFPINWVMDLLHWKLLLRAVWDAIIYLALAYVLFRKKVFVAL